VTQTSSSGSDGDRRPGSEAHAYPHDLARTVYPRWRELLGQTGVRSTELELLEQAISIAYQASLLQEEGRPVTFRVAFAEPDAFLGASVPSAGVHSFVFARRRPLDQHELRRLAPAASFTRSLIGATLDGDGGPEIWGLVHSGARSSVLDGIGQHTPSALPPLLMVAVTGPGRLLVSAGTTTLAVLSNGTLSGRGMDVFEAGWMQDFFADMGGVQWMAHVRGRDEAPEDWATLNATFGPALARNVLRRVLATVRGTRHGGTVIIVPHCRVPELLREGRYVNVKYEFFENDHRKRILTLTIELMNELAKQETPGERGTVGWTEYKASEAKRLVEMDRALFDVAHLIADLTHVDGAVLMTDRLELLGFGVEISGGVPEVSTVARARDLAGTEREQVRTDRVGTRHRSAYRLCHALRDALVIVVSQDGGLRFVRWHHDAVTYWDQVATAPFEV
jgi:hypothetical protein